MESSIRGNLNWVAFILAVCGAAAPIVVVVIVTKAYLSKSDQTRKVEQTLNVTGSARKRIRSDLAVWRISVSGEGKDLKTAFTTVKEASDRVARFLDAHKIPTTEIAVSSISTHTQVTQTRDKLKNVTSENTKYVLTRVFTVTSPRVDEIAAPAGEVTELIQDGLSVQSCAPEYYYTKLGELKIEMIGEATRDARMRGDSIATNAGFAITEIRNARMGVLQITPPNSTDVSDSGISDTTSIEKDVMSVVALTFGIETR